MRVLSVVCVLFLSPLISAVEAKQILPGPFPFELVEVIDGDTFRARVDIWLGQSVTVKVRLKGVDTPEMNGKCAAEKNWRGKPKFRRKLAQKKPSTIGQCPLRHLCGARAGHGANQKR